MDDFSILLRTFYMHIDTYIQRERETERQREREIWMINSRLKCKLQTTFLSYLHPKKKKKNANYTEYLDLE